MADWIRKPFGVVSGVGIGMGVLDFGGDRRKGRGSLGVNLQLPIVTNGDFVASLCGITYSDRAVLWRGEWVGPGIQDLTFFLARRPRFPINVTKFRVYLT